MNIINNKIKQYAGGNWSSNQFVKKTTRIPDSLFLEIPKYRSRKKRRKVDFEATYNGCPFCGTVLPEEGKQKIFIWHIIYAQKCPGCRAENKINSCPACKRDSWFKDGIYKHLPFLNCGFVGRKIENQSMR